MTVTSAVTNMACNMSVAKYKFVSQPEDDLVCLICLEVAEEPWQHGKCGRLLCKKCLDKLGKYKPCPNCRESQPQYFEDNRSKRAIQALHVKCNSVERGCEWIGTIATIEEHVATCEFTLLPCPKQCKDDEEEIKGFMRKDLNKHLKEDCPNRDHTCEYCGEKGTYAHITGTHDKTCPEKILPCPNDKCRKRKQRQEIETHLDTECEYTVIPCKYTRLGCETELIRKDMAAHEEDDKLHLHMAIDAITQLKSILITFKVTEFQEKKKKNIEFHSPSFYTSQKGYHMNINVDWDSGNVSVYSYFLKGDHDDKLSWPFVGEVTITLLNQLQDRNHFSKTIKILAEENIRPAGGEGNNMGYYDFIPHSELDYNPDKNTQYLKDDTLYFRVSVTIPNHKPWLECTAN